MQHPAKPKVTSMKRFVYLAVVLSFISTGIAIAALVTVQNSKPTWQEMTFTFEVTEDERFDIGATSHSHGDIDVIRGDLVSDGKVIGELISLRTVIDINEPSGTLEEDRMATTQLDFENGTINLQLLYTGVYGVPTSGHNEVAITGGTGDYVGIRGEASWVLNADGDRDMVLHYTLD